MVIIIGAIGLAVAIVSGLWPLALAGGLIIALVTVGQEADEVIYEAVEETPAANVWPWLAILGWLAIGAVGFALLGLAVSVSPH